MAAEGVADKSGASGCRVLNRSFNFEKPYGPLAEAYAQVHRFVPLMKATPEGPTNFRGDLAVVCGNCHVSSLRSGGSNGDSFGSFSRTQCEGGRFALTGQVPRS